jgi:hypothetical protein
VGTSFFVDKSQTPTDAQFRAALGKCVKLGRDSLCQDHGGFIWCGSIMDRRLWLCKVM